jgi:hypothetical protein
MAGNMMEHWLDTADTFVGEFMEVVKQCDGFSEFRLHDEDLWENLESRSNQRHLTQKSRDWEKVSDSWGEDVLNRLQNVSIGMSMAERTGRLARQIENWSDAVGRINRAIFDRATARGQGRTSKVKGGLRRPSSLWRIFRQLPDR